MIFHVTPQSTAFNLLGRGGAIGSTERGGIARPTGRAFACKDSDSSEDRLLDIEKLFAPGSFSRRDHTSSFVRYELQRATATLLTSG